MHKIKLGAELGYHGIAALMSWNRGTRTDAELQNTYFCTLRKLHLVDADRKITELGEEVRKQVRDNLSTYCVEEVTTIALVKL